MRGDEQDFINKLYIGMRYYYIRIGMAKSIKAKIPNTSENAEQNEFSFIAGCNSQIVEPF